MNPADWFSQLEGVLEREALHAGILEHGTMIGNVREFITRRVLQSFLPPATYVGTGKVIDTNGDDSKQVDIVLFDSRFPFFSSHEIAGLFPVEGVLATIEVKSDLGGPELEKALENCLSVTSRLPVADFRHSLEAIQQHYIQHGIDREDAFERRLREAVVPTYVFSFHGPTKAVTLANGILAWIQSKANAGEPLKTVYLPRLIVAGKLVAIINDGVFNISGPPGDQKVLYLVAETPHRLGLLAMHLLSRVCSRLETFKSQREESGFHAYLPVAAQQSLSQATNIAVVNVDKICSQLAQSASQMSQ